MGEVDRNPASGSIDDLVGYPSSALGKSDGDGMFLLERRGEATEPGTGSPNPETCQASYLEAPSPLPVAIPAPSPPPPPIQVPSFPSLSAHLPPASSSFGENSTQLEEPEATQGCYDHLT